MSQKKNKKTRKISSARYAETVLYLGLIPEEKFIKFFGISLRTARRWRKDKVFPFVKIRTKVFYRIEDVRKLLEDYYFKKQSLKK